MARTYRKIRTKNMADLKKVRRIDRKHALVLVSDGEQFASLAADVFVSDGRRMLYDRRFCDDRPYEIPNVKRKVKRLTARKLRRNAHVAEKSVKYCE